MSNRLLTYDNKDIVRHINSPKASGSHGQFGFDDNVCTLAIELQMSTSVTKSVYVRHKEK